MHYCSLNKLIVVVVLFFVYYIPIAYAQLEIATTTLTVTNCGNEIVETGEECDIVPPENGDYSTTIAGRQCTAVCMYGPYCGDGILQTVHGEECDDGNNNDGDFCGADCTIEPAGSGGGGSSGGGSSGGGSSVDLGDTAITVEGTAYPGRTVNIILDAESVGSVRASSNGDFDFSVDTEPGAATMGFWSTDTFGNRSITFNTTFDVTQGAITTVRGLMLPPTIDADVTEINPGDTVTFRGQTAPGVDLQLFIDDTQVADVTSSANGIWEIPYPTTGLSAAEYLAKVRYVDGTGSVISESSFSSALTLFVGVDGRATSPSDLNRDGSINLIDFSILIFWWQTSGGNSDPPADINGNGNVSIEDFSIMLFNWTG